MQAQASQTLPAGDSPAWHHATVGTIADPQPGPSTIHPTKEINRIMQLWLTPCTQPDYRVPPPAACPRAGCPGRRFRLHQAVAKPVRGVASRTVPAHRYTCQTCRRTFRAYPPGVDRGHIAVGVKQFATALHLLGLSFRDIGRALTVLGVPLRKSQAQTVVAPKLKGLRHRSIAMAPLLSRVTVDDSHDNQRAHVWIHGRPLTLHRALHRDGRAALVIEDVDRQTRYAVEQWIRATLAGFGVEARIVFPTAAPRRGAGYRPAVDAGVAAGDVDPVDDDGAVDAVTLAESSADATVKVTAAAFAPDAANVLAVRGSAVGEAAIGAAVFASTAARPPTASMLPGRLTIPRCSRWRLPARPRTSHSNPLPEDHGQTLSKGF